MRLLLVFSTFALFGQTPPEEKRAGSPLAPAEQQRNSLAKQKETARKQAASAGALLMPWEEWRLQPSPALEADCDALADSTVKPLIEGAARQQNVDAKLLRAVMEQESGFRPCAISSRGAQGLMQLMPGTAERFHVTDPFDPKQNIDAGAKYLKQLLDQYKGDTSLALAAYNAGPASTDTSSGIPDIPETKAYVDAILRRIDAAKQ